MMMIVKIVRWICSHVFGYRREWIVGVTRARGCHFRLRGLVTAVTRCIIEEICSSSSYRLGITHTSATFSFFRRVVLTPTITKQFPFFSFSHIPFSPWEINNLIMIQAIAIPLLVVLWGYLERNWINDVNPVGTSRRLSVRDSYELISWHTLCQSARNSIRQIVMPLPSSLEFVLQNYCWDPNLQITRNVLLTTLALSL